MLTEQGIAARRLRYRCCALDYLSRAIDAKTHGDNACYEENRRKWLWMDWAAWVMQDTPIEGDEHPGCTLLPFASDVADKADCLCDICGCPEAPDPDCAITPDFTVLEALSQDELPGDAEDGDAYYLLEGENIGDIATWQTDAWVFSGVPTGSIVWATVTNDYWTNTGSTPGPLFSAPLLVMQVPGVWQLSLLDPQTAQGRTVTLQGLGPSDWYDLTGPLNESSLPQLLFLAGLQFTAARLLYEDTDGCEYTSGNGSFEPPVVPPTDCTIVPAFTADQLVDANQQGLLPPGRYWIISNEFSVSNDWSQNVDSIVDTSVSPESFTPVPLGNVVYDLSTQVYWWLTSAGPSPLFPPVTVTMNIGTYTVASDYPAQSAVGTRTVLVFDSTQTVIWNGTEDQLPQTVTSTYQPVGPVTARYFNTPDCFYDVEGTIEIDAPIQVDFDCGEIQYYTYRYSDQYVEFLFTAPPGEVVTLTFAQGEMDGSGIAIRAYSGTTDFDPPITGLTGNFPSLAGVSGTSAGNTMLFVVESGQVMPEELQTWLFGVQCTSGAVPPDGFVTSEDKCDAWAFTLNVDVLFLGDSTEISIQYTVDGGTPVVIPGIDAEGTYGLGNFPFGSEVVVILLHESDPLGNRMLGIFTGDDSCPIVADPCAPEGASKIDEAGSCEDIPIPAPVSGWAYLVTGGSCPEYPIGEIFVWNSSTQEYEPSSTNPGVYYTQSPPQFWVTQGVGVQPYPLLAQGVLSPSGQNPLNWLLHLPAVAEYQTPINRPVALEVRNGLGPWQQVWTGTEQQLILPYLIAISVPFTGARIIYDYDTCGMTSGVLLNQE